MAFELLTPLGRRAGIAVAAVLFAAGFVAAQNTASPALTPAPSIDQFLHSQFSGAGYSSSQTGLGTSEFQMADFSLPGAANPRSSAAMGGGQYGQGGENGGGGKHRIFHSWTFEAGGGFNAPVGNDTPYITWGGNFTGGGGLRFNKVFSLLAEYQFIDDKLPGAFIAAGGGEQGNAHISAITGSPVINLFPKWSNGAYLVGGYGYYHKSTNFNVEECCDFYGYPVEVTANSITSNQWGGNIGFGLYHRLGGDMYGPGTAGQTEVFAEARYTFIHTPPINQTNGLGTTELIPVTLGVRF
ncbi:MAG TPA: hypothetical protein VGG45_04970 [Terracidiphilus sp.]